MRLIPTLLAAGFVVASSPVLAADPAPEIQRPLGTAQAVGAVVVSISVAVAVVLASAKSRRTTRQGPHCAILSERQERCSDRPSRAATKSGAVWS